MTDRQMMLLSAVIVGAGLVYLGSQIGGLTAAATSVTESPLARLVTSLGGAS